MVIGCQPEASAVMAHSVEAGRIIDMPSRPTLSDGTAGGIESGAITFDLCREIVDEYVLVPEEAIADAMRSFIDRHHMLAEGAAAVALAGVLSEGHRFRKGNVVAVVCGGNVSRETLKKVL
jgi:threonine dehydratase